MVKRERLKRKIEDKKKRLDLYKEKEAYMLSKDGVQSYGVGSRNAARYNLDLAEVRKAIDELETEIDGKCNISKFWKRIWGSGRILSKTGAERISGAVRKCARGY